MNNLFQLNSEWSKEDRYNFIRKRLNEGLKQEQLIKIALKRRNKNE